MNPMNASEPREDAVAGHDDFAEWLARDWPLYHVNGIVAVRMRSAWNAALAQQGAEPVAWQPIETAPKDGRVVLFCDRRGNRWTQVADCRTPICGYPPAYWHELPTPATGAPR